MRRAGTTAGAGGMDPLTTADAVPVTGRSRSHSEPLYRRRAGREGLNRTHPPGPRRGPRPITAYAFMNNAV